MRPDDAIAPESDESDTESLFDPEFVENVAVRPDPVRFEARRNCQEAFARLDEVNVNHIFETRAHVMKFVPLVMRGAFRRVLRLAMDEILEGRESHSVLRQERGWKLFFLIPRMLLSRPPRGGLIPRKKLESRLAAFAAGQWSELIDASCEMCSKAKEAMVRKGRRQTSTDMKVVRAEKLAMMGELSAARQVLESPDVAPGNNSTLRVLTRQDKRPALPREPPPRELMERVPERPFLLDDEKFAKNFRSVRRGAAPGPSGMTTEHFFPLLESMSDTQAFCQLGNLLVQGEVPPGALSILRKGRMTALQKPSGGVRGIVVGDTFRRLVARTMAQQVSEAVEVATSPFQYALRTRAGCECVSHVLQTLTDLDEHATILSVDGVGAFDLISRK